MIPRIFISSTYFDLKHVRERLESFILNYGFEPILFESDKVTYQHGKPIDQSAYYEVNLCHVMILIIGGRYGSPSSSENSTDERKKYDDEFVSITRKEFETAIQNNIPIMIFVDKNVNADYETYKENQDFFDTLYLGKESREKKFKFAHVDHVNVFKFIDIVRTRPVKTFEKVDEIELYLKMQFSGLFYLYLESLKRKSEESKILNSIEELNNVTLRMNEMVTFVGKKILGKDEAEYEKVIRNQLAILFDYYCDRFYSEIKFVNEYSEEEIEKLDTEKITRILYYDGLKIDIPVLSKYKDFEEYKKFKAETNSKILTPIQNKLSEIKDDLVLERFEYRTLNEELKQKVLPFIKDNADEELLIADLKKQIEYTLGKLPF